MANTLPGSPYIESSDLVANYPGVSETLAERVDTVGVLPFADSAARTTAIPSPVEGQMSSLADTDSVERYDGSAWVAVAGGKVLQVVSTAKTDIWTSSATSFTAVTGLSASITPTATSSKILITVQLSVGGQSANSLGFWKMTRGGTDIYVGDAAGSRVRAVFGGYVSGNIQDLMLSNSIIYLDSPATTSATTYQVEGKADTVGTIKLNAAANDADNAGYLRGASSITVMEISA